MILELVRVLKSFEFDTVGNKGETAWTLFGSAIHLKTLVTREKNQKQLLTMDLLALASMKNAAKCDT